MTTNLEGYILRGIFSSYCIQDMQTSGLLFSPSINVVERTEQEILLGLPLKIRSGSAEMSKYYRFLYVIENMVRDFIINIFREIDGEDWFETRASSTMKKKYSDRKKDEKQNQWHSGRNQHQIYYLDFGDLTRLIINHWDLFKDYFPDQSWVKSRLNEFELTRNVIAHTNDLPADEGARIEMYLKDFIRQLA
jgi:hypothetical protein